MIILDAVIIAMAPQIHIIQTIIRLIVFWNVMIQQVLIITIKLFILMMLLINVRLFALKLIIVLLIQLKLLLQLSITAKNVTF